MTTTSLPVQRTSWINQLVASLRKYKVPAAEDGRQLSKKNQFLVGESNFDYIAIFLVVLPCVAWFMGTMGRQLINVESELTTERKVHYIASAAGVVGGYAMSFFLIPVARHSVLLVAMGWSPVNALRLHIWAGYTSFFFLAVHTILYVTKWFVYYDDPVWVQIKPKSLCWGWSRPSDMSLADHRRACSKNWYNFTGTLVALFFLILLATSLNWFRRRWYRVFYLVHVSMGTLIILTSMLHWGGFVLAIAPSIAYYLASTIPTLIQALASRFRGGVRIIRVVEIPDAGDCVEVHVEANAEAQAALERKPCLFCKLCIPSISIVWHPFTVFMHPQDGSSVRFLFRPVGPFTRSAAAALLSSSPPITIIDGFYSGEDRVQEALQHDHVSIVAGGVAVTPFLSMIPSILACVASNGNGKYVPIKKLALHWVCREEGLIRYIMATYMNAYLVLSDELGFDFTIEVYYTGSSPIGDNGSLISMATGETQDVEMTSEPIILKGDNGDKEDGTESSAGDKAATSSAGDEVPGGSTSTTIQNGHAMEVGRMMPERNEILWRNIPLVLAAGSIMWVSFVLIVRWYSIRTPVHNQFYIRVWGVLLALLVAMGASVAFECMILVARNYWPKSDVTQPYQVTRAFQSVSERSANSSTRPTAANAVKLTLGRPDPSKVLADSKNYVAPGVFVCGPVPLMEAIRREAALEDKVGLTRICLYEELFEM